MDKQELIMWIIIVLTEYAVSVAILSACAVHKWKSYTKFYPEVRFNFWSTRAGLWLRLSHVPFDSIIVTMILAIQTALVLDIVR